MFLRTITRRRVAQLILGTAGRKLRGMGCHAPEGSGQKAELAAYLAAHRARYLGFVRSRIHDPATAEDVLQDVIAKALAHTTTLRGEIDPWFFRSLRNAMVDHLRRRGASARALEAFANEQPEDAAIGDAAPRPCPCVLRLQRQMKPEFAHALEQVEVVGRAVKDFAAESGISASNAGVRVFRAREALRRDVVATCGPCAANGCTDCTCTEEG